VSIRRQSAISMSEARPAHVGVVMKTFLRGPSHEDRARAPAMRDGDGPARFEVAGQAGGPKGGNTAGHPAGVVDHP